MTKQKKELRTGNICPVDVGARLKRLRCALGFRQIEFAKHIGISTPSWNKYELGRQAISVYHASLLMKQTGATLDWIYHGKKNSMPIRLLERLKKSNGHKL